MYIYVCNLYKAWGEVEEERGVCEREKPELRHIQTKQAQL